jgi:anti-anti-sigma factor
MTNRPHEGRDMTHPYRHIEVERRGEVFCVRLRHTRLDEQGVYELFGELNGLVTDEGCRQLALSLGPESPECLYSVFLAKLIALQRLLQETGGELVLCHVQPAVRTIFQACRLEQLFRFQPDFESVAAAKNPTEPEA